MAERSAHGTSPPTGCAAQSEPFLLVERTGLGALNLRGSGRAFMTAAAETLGAPLPAVPNTTSACEQVLVLWLAPDEWLVRLAASDVEAQRAALARDLVDCRAAVLDVSDRDRVLRISGEAARDVLAAGCPLDLHPRVFRPGACARSHYLKIPVLIHRIGEGSIFDVGTPRSYADDLWVLLLDAGSEFLSDRSQGGVDGLDHAPAADP